MNRLTSIAKLAIAGIEDDLVDVAKDMTPRLREPPVRALVANFLDAVREAYPPAREPLRRAIAEIIEYERRYWKNLSARVNPAIAGHLAFGRWGQDLPLEVTERLLEAMTQTGHYETAVSMLINRINSNPTELDHWKPLCLRLATVPDLVRSHQMAGFYWKGAAKRLLPEHAEEIAAAILSQHQSQDWLIGHSAANEVLRWCVEQNPAAVWRAIEPLLSSLRTAEVFSIGRPNDILARLPSAPIKTWVSEQPDERAPIVAQLCGTDLSDDTTLPATVLSEFGENERVALSTDLIVR